MKSRNIEIHDCTLREGLQSPGLFLQRKEKIRLGKSLEQAGVDKLEAGIPVMGQEEEDFLKELKRELSIPVIGWCRAKKQDILRAAQTGLSQIHIAVPLSDQLLQLYGLSEVQLWILMENISLLARNHMSSFSFGAMDTTRAPLSRIKRFCRIARKQGASLIRISDSTGISTPWEIEKLFKRVAPVCGSVPLEFHGHNDLGLATANSLAALRGGARSLSLTLLGTGERAGNAALEQMVCLLKQEGFHCGVKGKSLYNLCRDFAEMASLSIDPRKPIVGKYVFTHESGIHGHGLIQNPQSFCQLDPGDFQREHQFLAGSHSGSFMISKMLQESGINLSRQEASDFLNRVQSYSLKFRRGLDPQGLKILYLEYEREILYQRAQSL